MKISELSASTGVSIPVIKLYIREGLLRRGEATAPTQSTYGDDHVARIRLVEALRSVQDMPLAKIRQILSLIDSPEDDLVSATGKAVAALPPYPLEPPTDLTAARRAVEAIGLPFLPDFPATAQLQLALEALATAGLPSEADVIKRYATPLWAVAKAEVSPMVTLDDAQAVAYAVLGTGLYEPLILALRRLMHRHLLTQPHASELTA